MADNLTTTTQVDPAVGIFYDRVLLKRGLPWLIHNKFAQERNISGKSGDTIKFRRYSALTVATTPLSEGKTPPGQLLAKTDLTAKVSQYGDFVHITDIVDLTVEDAVLTEAAELLGEQMGQTLDILVRDILAACASSTTPSDKKLSTTNIDAVVATLLTNKAQMISNVIPAGTGVGTVPIRPAYVAMMNTVLIKRLEANAEFTPTAKYPAQSPIMEHEWGSVKNARFLVSQQGHDAGSGADPRYFVMFFGKNAYGTTNIDGSTAKNIVKAFGSGGTEDPLNQRATSGWKTTFVCRILNDNFMHIMKVNDIAL